VKHARNARLILEKSGAKKEQREKGKLTHRFQQLLIAVSGREILSHSIAWSGRASARV
jgi:hypothetical protein